MSAPPEVHLTPQGQTLRMNSWGQAYALTESGPVFDGTPRSVHELIIWLGVERHARWAPVKHTTFCNVYAHDLTRLMGAYIPRVWWSASALNQIAGGRVPAPSLGSSLLELSANGLYHWLENWGKTFGWERVQTLDELQASANQAWPAVICARKIVDASPGHISCVVAESARLRAHRNEQDFVVYPVQSQAGAKNAECSTIGSPWWDSPSMAAHGFWIHPPTGSSSP